MQARDGRRNPRGGDAISERRTMTATSPGGWASQLSGSPAMTAQRQTVTALFGSTRQRVESRPQPQGPAAEADPRQQPAQRQVMPRSGVGAIPAANGIVQRGLSMSTVDDEQVAQDEYAKQVRIAKDKLIGHIGFGASPEDQYDADHWEKIADPKYRFAIKAKSKPSVALRALMDHRDKWSFDCAEFVQVCNLYASLEVYGEEHVDRIEHFVLRQHGSSTLEPESATAGAGGVTFDRPGKDVAFDAVFPKIGNKYVGQLISEQDMLKALPVGARVCFKNPAAPDTPYRNENAIVEGGDTYAAHPMGSGLSAQAIVGRLVQYNQSSDLGGENGGADRIFISQAEIYPSIPLSASTLAALKLTPYAGFL